MSETPTNGPNGRFKAAAESTVLQLLARCSIVFMMAVALPFGAWTGSRLVESIDALVHEVGALKLSVNGIEKDIDYLQRDIADLKDK